MSNSPPLSFETLSKTARNPAEGGYPYSLKGSDLDRNFVFATLVVDPSLFEETTGSGGHKARKLKIPTVPKTPLPQALTATLGSLSWVPTIPDGKSPGQMLYWNATDKAWQLITPPTTGTHVLGVKDGTLQWIATEEC